MMFFGDFLCGNEMSVPCTPTNIDNITRIELSNGWYDDLRITKNIEEELSSAINQDWDWDTILHAKFDSSVGGGNVLWNLSTVSHLLIKRKKINEFKWTILEVQKINDVKDFNLKNTDSTAIPGYKYQYAAIPVINGVEGFYSICEEEVKSNSLVIVDRDGLISSFISDFFLDNTSVVPNTTITTMHDKFPTIISNSSANYEEVSVTAQFIPQKDDGCSIDLDDDTKLFKYNQEVKEFLRNGNMKIIKSPDSRNWLCYINQPPSDSADSLYKIRKLSFGAVEVGSVESEEDLFEAGFIDASEEWWNK